ncbi:hypothetical protein CP8484711_0230A, partial [Chlamydia psittaci 84-8471/1]
MRLFIIAQMV